MQPPSLRGRSGGCPQRWRGWLGCSGGQCKGQEGSRGEAGSPRRLGRGRIKGVSSGALAHASPCLSSRISSGAGGARQRVHRPGFGAPRSRGPHCRLCRGAAPRLSPFPGPCPWPWQAAGSAEDESRSLVSPLAAIAVKLEQRPANKAPPPLAPLPAARSSAFHSSAHRGICPFTLVICMIKAVLLPFLQPALKRQGSWSGRTGRGAGGVRAARAEPSSPGPCRAVPCRAAEGAAPAAPLLGSRRGGGRKALSPARGFAFQFCSH